MNFISYFINLIIIYSIFCPCPYSQILQKDSLRKVLGMGQVLEYDQSKWNGYTLLRTSNGIYRINSDHSFQHLANLEKAQGIYISPNGNNILIDYITGQDVIVDSTQWNIIVSINDGEYPYDPYSLDSQNILYKNKQGIPTIFNITDQTITLIKEINDTEYVFWGNNSARIYSVTRGIDELPSNPYAQKSSYFLNEWGIENAELMKSLKLDNAGSFGDDISKSYKRINLIKLNSQNDVVVNTLENAKIYWYSSYLFDFFTGNQKYFWDASGSHTGSKKILISSNGHWIAYVHLNMVGFIDTVNINTTNFFSWEPFSYYDDSVFSADSGSALIRESNGSNLVTALDLIDLNSGIVQNKITLLNQPVTKADIVEDQILAFLSGNYSYSVIHQESGNLLVEGLGHQKYQDLMVLPDLNQLLLCAGNEFVFADFAQKKQVRWHGDPDLQNILYLSRFETSNEIVATGYSIINDATVSLIKTLTFPALTTKAIIQDGSEIITAFNRSQDGRLIITGYEDGSVKIRNLESGVVEQVLKLGTSKILYISLLHENRLIAVDEERNAFVWNGSQNKTERTIPGLHLPARVSITRGLLFAGTDVYDVTNGEKVYRFSDESSDLYSIEISSKEECLLTSTANGETYLWDLPLIFDIDSTVPNFQQY